MTLTVLRLLKSWWLWTVEIPVWSQLNEINSVIRINIIVDLESWEGGGVGIRILALPKLCIKNSLTCPLLCCIEQSVYTFSLIYKQHRVLRVASGHPVPLGREACSVPSRTTASLLDIIHHYDPAFTPSPLYLNKCYSAQVLNLPISLSSIIFYCIF